MIAIIFFLRIYARPENRCQAFFKAGFYNRAGYKYHTPPFDGMTRLVGMR